MRSGAFTMVCVKNNAFWDAMVCSLINMYQQCGGKSKLQVYDVVTKVQITTWTVHHVLDSSKPTIIRRCDCLLSNFTF
jgi:hypothetical protein